MGERGCARRLGGEVGVGGPCHAELPVLRSCPRLAGDAVARVLVPGLHERDFGGARGWATVGVGQQGGLCAVRACVGPPSGLDYLSSTLWTPSTHAGIIATRKYNLRN